MSADNRPALPLLPDLQDQADACLPKENGLERTALQPAELALGMLSFSSEPPEGASMHAWAQKVLNGLSTHDTRITGTWRGMLAFVLLADVLPEPLKLRASMLPAFSTAVGNAAGILCLERRLPADSGLSIGRGGRRALLRALVFPARRRSAGAFRHASGECDLV